MYNDRYIKLLPTLLTLSNCNLSPIKPIERLSHFRNEEAPVIKSISIENFRCFQKLAVSGFERVNLISGKNNAGKTALLEALFLNSSPRPDTIILLRQIRRESTSFSRALPERTWNNLFAKQEKSREIQINSNLGNGDSKVVKIFEDELIKDFFEEKTEKDGDDGELEEISNLFSGSESTVSVLHLKTEINAIEAFETSVLSSAKGIVGRDIKIPDTKNAYFVPTFLRIRSRELAERFDIARLNEKDSEILAAIKAIDSSIVEVESFSIGEPSIYLKRTGESRLPLSLFGDGINRIVDIILRIVNNENSILLVDEIENGIHHSNQFEFWSIIYRLANSLNVQVFATTHSLEMVQAFIKAGSEYSSDAAHFELARNAKTGNIVAIRRDLETLDYGISHNKEVRGGA